MKHLYTLALLFAAAFAQAQGAQTAFESIPGPLSSCPSKAVSHDILCDVIDVGWEESINGADYAPFNQSGTNGINGTDGTNGTNGATPTLAFGNVSTLAAGSPATATVDPASTPAAIILDLGIPVGATGAPGAPGAVGPQGPPGIANGSTFTLTCKGEAGHSIGSGFATTCTISNLVP